MHLLTLKQKEGENIYYSRIFQFAAVEFKKKNVIHININVCVNIEMLTRMKV